MLGKVCRKLSIPVPGGGSQRREVYAGSFHVATYDNGTTFFDHTDWQGTERVRSNVTGVSALTCTNLPYGDNQSCVGPLDPSPQHFTGKMRDPETGLDYFGARYYSSGTARWMLPDWSAVPEAVPYADMSNPQSLNLYTYVGNNPINGVDADGHDPASQNGGAQCGSSVGEQGLAAGNAPGQVACSSPAPAQQQESQAGQDFIKGYESLSLTVYDASKGKVKGGLKRLFLCSAFLLVFVCLGQAIGRKKDIPLAPLPAAVTQAKKVYLLNGQTTSRFLTKNGNELAFDDLYADMKSWGRYEIVGSPSNRANRRLCNLERSIYGIGRGLAHPHPHRI
jgi:RHS repeat-associated protein